jgi:ABC-type multidrug transport system fused ATPase/permease subunit
MIGQSILALLDLVGVALLGMVAGISAASISGVTPEIISKAVTALGFEDENLTHIALLLAGVAGVLLVLKSVFSFVLTRQAFKFLARRQARISTDLANELLAQPLVDVQQHSSQEVAYALTKGVNAATLGVIGSMIIIVSEISLITVLAIGLSFIDVWVMIFTVTFFGILGFALHRTLSGWAARLGSRMSTAEIESHALVQEALRTYREITVSARRKLYVDRFQSLRWDAAAVLADVQIMNQISKYVFEIAIIIGGGILVFTQLASRDVAGAVAVIAVFLAAASRIMPSLLRLQAAALEIRVGIELSRPTFNLVRVLNFTPGAGKTGGQSGQEVLQKTMQGLADEHYGFTGDVRLIDVSLTYAGSEKKAVDNVSIIVNQGSSLGIVGSSGAGKSTVADLMLGVVHADSGKIEISGLSPAEAVEHFPGAIAYVPQDVAVISGTIRDNVALGIPQDVLSDNIIINALTRAHLYQFLKDERDGLETLVGENGVQLSGGQRQRLGIARALLTNPQLLILDEATSALDAETERLLSDTISELEGEVTLIIIAHRLATIMNCEQVACLQEGRLVGVGTFSEVRQLVPQLENQAKLLGL